MEDQRPAQSIVRAIKILELLAREQGAGITFLAREMATNKSSVYRIVNTLKQLGYVRQDRENDKYSLTIKLQELGSAACFHSDLRNEAVPIMERIARETEETIHLAALEEEELVYLHKVDSTQTLKVSMMSSIGKTAPLYCTGLGKALLAWLPERQQQEILKKQKLHKHTANTPATPESIRKALAETRQQGFSIDNEEHEIGVRCVAAPIFDRKGDVVAALSIAGPSIRMTKERMDQYTPLIVAAAKSVSTKLGFME